MPLAPRRWRPLERILSATRGLDPHQRPGLPARHIHRVIRGRTSCQLMRCFLALPYVWCLSDSRPRWPGPIINPARRRQMRRCRKGEASRKLPVCLYLPSSPFWPIAKLMAECRGNRADACALQGRESGCESPPVRTASSVSISKVAKIWRKRGKLFLFLLCQPRIWARWTDAVGCFVVEKATFLHYG
jgi:hypothetical protein